jgi:transposase
VDNRLRKDDRENKRTEVVEMSEHRQSYNEEFKRQTVKFIQDQTKTVPQLAEELNIPSGTLHNWLGKYRVFESEPVASADKIRELELLILEKDRLLTDLEEELAIVKKTVHIFSKPRN